MNSSTTLLTDIVTAAQAGERETKNGHKGTSHFINVEKYVLKAHSQCTSDNYKACLALIESVIESGRALRGGDDRKIFKEPFPGHEAAHFRVIIREAERARDTKLDTLEWVGKLRALKDWLKAVFPVQSAITKVERKEEHRNVDLKWKEDGKSIGQGLWTWGLIEHTSWHVPSEDFTISCGTVAVKGYQKNGDQRKILCIFKERLGQWQLPKGRVSMNETYTAAAFRETIEETGEGVLPLYLKFKTRETLPIHLEKIKKAIDVEINGQMEKRVEKRTEGKNLSLKMRRQIENEEEEKYLLPEEIMSIAERTIKQQLHAKTLKTCPTPSEEALLNARIIKADFNNSEGKFVQRKPTGQIDALNRGIFMATGYEAPGTSDWRQIYWYAARPDNGELGDVHMSEEDRSDSTVVAWVPVSLAKTLLQINPTEAEAVKRIIKIVDENVNTMTDAGDNWQYRDKLSKADANQVKKWLKGKN